MVYIYYNDFDCENWGVGEEGDYFECDDLIAPAIIALNKRGYVTEACCAGHPYRNVILDGAFIKFKYPFRFEELPDGFTYDAVEGMLEEVHTDDARNDWSGMECVVNINKALYQWACSLPTISIEEVDD